MKRFAAVLFVLFAVSAIHAFAHIHGDITDQQVAYVSGTATQVKAGAVGVFDTTQAKRLTFQAGSDTIEMPYSAMSRFEYYREVTHHIGVIPHLVVGMVKRRERQHFFVITWKDSTGLVQTATFEVSKHAPEGLLAVLRARAPQACSGGYTANKCGVREGSGGY